MTVLSLSPSLVDQYRYWRYNDHYSPEHEANSLADLLSQIKKEKREPNEHMLRGRGWGACVESGVQVGGICSDPDSGTCFEAEGVIEVRRAIGLSVVFEAWGTLELPEIGVRMRLRADGLAVPTVHEVKAPTKVSTEKYADSCQWRAYLEAFGCDEVKYHICRLGTRRGKGVYYLAEYRPFSLYRYPDMRGDLISQVAECKAFIEAQGLTQYRQEI
jgi:hypothetical protein